MFDTSVIEPNVMQVKRKKRRTPWEELDNIEKCCRMAEHLGMHYHDFIAKAERECGSAREWFEQHKEAVREVKRRK